MTPLNWKGSLGLNSETRVFGFHRSGARPQRPPDAMFRVPESLERPFCWCRNPICSMSFLLFFFFPASALGSCMGPVSFLFHTIHFYVFKYWSHFSTIILVSAPIT